MARARFFDEQLARLGTHLSSAYASAQRRFARLFPRFSLLSDPQTASVVRSLVGTAKRARAERGQFGRRLSLEPMEARRLLSATYWVNDNWVVTAPPAHVGSAPVVGDIVANTGAGDDGSVTGKTFGVNAFANVQGALSVANSNDTIDILAGSYSVANPVQISQHVTIVGQAYGSGETLTGVNGVFNIASNITINGSGGFLTLSGASGADPYGSGFTGAAAVLTASGTGSTITGCTFSGNAIGIGVTAGLSSYTISSDSFTGNQVGIVALSNGTIGTGNTFDGDNAVGPHQSQGVYVGSGATVGVSGSTFRNLNASAATAPGGIVVDGGSSVTSSGNQFYNDTVGIRVIAGTLSSSSDSIGSSIGSVNATGVLALGGSTILSNDTIINNTTGVDVAKNSVGSVSLNGNRFAIGSTVNVTDLEVESGAEPVTIGAGNSFAGSTFYIDNLSTQNFDLSSNGTTFSQSSPYAIEDRIWDVIDQAGLGLVRIQAGAVFVSQNSGNPAGAIARAEAAAPGNAVYVQAQNSFTVPTSPTVQYGAVSYTLAGTVTTVDAGFNPLPFLVPSGNVAVTVLGNTTTVPVDAKGNFSAVVNTQSVTAGTNIGNQYPITYTFLGDGTIIYSLTGTGGFVPATNPNTVLKVGPAILSANLVVQNKNYDGTTNATLVSSSLSGVVQGDSISLTSVGTPSFVSPNASTAAVATAPASVTGSNLGYYVWADPPGLNVASSPSGGLATGTATIAPVALTLTAVANTKVYDGTTSAAAVPTLTGKLVGSDTVTSNSETYDTKNVGTNKTLIPAIQINGGNDANYAVSIIPVTAGVITPYAITVTAQPNTKVYDGTTSASTAPMVTSGSLQGTDTLGLTEVYASKAAGTGLTLTPTGTINDGNGGANYKVTTVNSTAGVITPLAITVTAKGVNKTYDATFTATVTLSATPIKGDVVTYNYTAANFSQSSVGANLLVTVSGISLGGPDGANYAVSDTTTTTTASITARAITVTATSDSKPYDGTTTSSAVPTITAGGVPAGDTVTLSESYDSKNAGSRQMIPTATFASGNSNYAITAVNAPGSILARAITVTAQQNFKTYDGTTSALATPVVTGGLVAGDTANFSEVYATKNVGNFIELIPTGSVSDGNNGNNYSATFVPVYTGVISVRAITVTAAPASKAYDGTIASTVAPTITSGSLGTGDTANFIETYATKNVGNNITMTPSGTVNDGFGGSDYQVTLVQANVGNITPLTVTLTPAPNSKPYDGNTSAAAFPIFTPALKPGDTAVGASETYATTNVGTGLTMNATYSSINDGNGGGNYIVIPTPANVGVITPLTLVVQATANSRAYDGTTNAAAKPVIISGSLLGSDTAAFTESYASKNVGTNLTLIPGGGVSPNPGDYAVTFVPVNAGVITALAITVTAQPNTKTYDGTTSAAATPTISPPLEPGDTSGFIESYASPIAGTGLTLIPSGSAIDGNNGNNYSVNFVSSNTGVINGTQITVTATPYSKGYDGTTSASGATLPTITSGSLLPGDSATFSESFASKNAGNESLVPSIVISGPHAAGYSVTYVDALGTISPRALTVTAIANTKVYDGTVFATVVPQITSGSLAPGDTFGFTESFPTKNIGTNLTITPTGAVNDGNGGSNYTVTKVDSTGSITIRFITVTAAPNTKGYDGTTSAATAPTITPSLGTGDTSNLIETYASPNVGSGILLTPSGNVNDGSNGSNYSITYVPEPTGVITLRAITVTAAPNTKPYDGNTSAAAIPTITSGSLLAGDTGTFSETYGSKNAGTGLALIPVGSISGPTSSLYSVTFVTSITGVITPRAIVVTAAANTKVYDSTLSAAAVPTITSGSLLTGDTASFTEIYKTKNAGGGLTLTPTGTVNDGNGGNNYAATFVPVTTGVITPAPITVTAAPNTKTYDGTVSAAALPTITSGSLLGTDTIAFTETYNTPNVGTGLTLTPNGTVNDGNNGLNYAVTKASVNAGVINPATLTISASPNTKAYDGTTTATTIPTYGGLQTGDHLTNLSESYDNKNVGTSKTLSVNSTYSLTNPGDYTVVTNTAPGVITPQALTVTANPSGNTKVYDGTTYAAAQPSITSGTLVSPDTANFTEVYTTRNVGTGLTLTPTGAVNDGNGGNNYVVTFVTVSNGVITQAALTVTAVTNIKSFDGTTSAATPPAVVGLQKGDTANFIETYASPNVGVNILLTPTGTVNDGNGGNNYSKITFVPENLGVISTRGITVTAVTNSKIYDGTTSAATQPTITSGSLLPGDTATFTESYASKNVGTALTLTPAGSVNGPDAANYTLTFVPVSTGVITAEAITVAAQPNTKTYDGTTSAATLPTIISGSLQGSDKFGFTESYAKKDVGAGLTLTPTGAVNDGNGGANYKVTLVTSTAGVITPAPLTVTAVPSTKVYDGTVSASVFPAITGGSVAPGDGSNFLESYSSKNVGTGLTLTPSGTVMDGNGGNDYSVAFVSVNTGVITIRPIVVTAVTNTKPYDATTSAAAVPVIGGGVGSGDTPNFVETYNNSSVGTGKTLTPSGTINDGNGGKNYSVTFVPTFNGAITLATVMVTANAQTKLYGTADPALTYTATGFVDGDTAATVLTGSLSRASGEALGSYPIFQGSLALASGATNYVLAFTGSSLSINASVWVNDNWVDVSRPGGPLTPGDIVQAPTGEVIAGTTATTLTYGSNAFSTIQSGVNAVNSFTGGSVYVLPGTYREDVTISQSVSLIGPNAGVNPITGTRGAEAVLEPATSVTDPSNPSATVVINVGASNVSVTGLTVNGDNTLVNSGHTSGIAGNTADINAAEGIASSKGIGNVTVTDDIVENCTYAGVELYNNLNSGVPTSDNLISANSISNIGDPTYGFGMGVLLLNNAYAQVTNNAIQDVRVGVQTGNFSQANSDSSFAPSISNNTVSATAAGIFFNTMGGSSSTFSLTNNAISAVSSTTEPRFEGVYVASLSGSSGVAVSGNKISGAGVLQQAIGYDIWNDPSGVTISGGSITGGNYGVIVTNNDATSGAGAQTAVTVNGVTISGYTQAGVYVQDSSSTHLNVSAAIQGGSSITPATSGYPVGLLVDGGKASASFPGAATFSANTGGNGEYIHLINGAMVGHTLNAEGVTFDGTLGSALTPGGTPSAYFVEDRIQDAIDASGVGLVRLNTNNLYVTPNSYVPGTSVASGAVGRAAAVAQAGDAINIDAALSFSNLTPSQSIGLGTPTVSFAGNLNHPSWIPAPQGYATIALNGVVQSSPINPATGAIASTFNTSALPSGAYPVTYTYSGYTDPVTAVSYVYSTNGATSTTDSSTSVTVAISISGAKTATEGQPYLLTLGAIPPQVGGGATQFVNINWGDGTSTFASPGAGTGNQSGSDPNNLLPYPTNGVFTHVYQNGTSQPSTLISVYLYAANLPSPVLAGSLTITVLNIPPTASVGGVASVLEGQPSSVFFYNQFDPSSINTAAGFHYAYDFNSNGIWDLGGNGSTATYATGVISSSVAVPAQYLDAPSTTVTMRIIDQDNGYTDYHFVITVGNLPPTVTLVSSAAVTTNVPFTSNGSFSDPGMNAVSGGNKETYSGLVFYGDSTDPKGGTVLALNANGTFTLNHTYTAAGPYTVTVQVTDSNGAVGSSSFPVTVTQGIPTTFQVSAFNPATSGFDVTFNRAANMTKIHLYDGLSPSGTNLNFGESNVFQSDVVLTGNTVGTVHGSLVWDATTDTAEFVQTSGVLAPDTYHVTLVSPDWQDTSGNPLNGGSNYTATFTVAANTNRVISVPNVARGPGQPLNVAANGTALATGLPIIVSDGTGVEGFDFALDYNPSLLQITSAAFGSGVPSAWGTLSTNEYNIVNIDATHAKVYVSVADPTGANPISAGSQTLIVLTGAVVSATPGAGSQLYGSSCLLNLEGVDLASAAGSISVVGAQSIFKDMNFGDANGDGRINGSDASLVSRIGAHLDSGFFAAPLTDPVVVGDVSGDGKVNSQDAADISRYGAHLPVPQIPAPVFIPAAPGDIAPIDPTVQIGSATTLAQPGAAVPTSVRITDDAHGLQEANFTIIYNSQLLVLANQDVLPGAGLAGKGWSITENINNVAGIATISLSGQQALTGTPELLDLVFHVRSDAAAGTSPLDIISGSLNSGQLEMTAVDGSITVTPHSAVAGLAMQQPTVSSSLGSQSVQTAARLPWNLSTKPVYGPRFTPADAVASVLANGNFGASRPIVGPLDSLLASHQSQSSAGKPRNAWDAALTSLFGAGS